MLLLRAINKMIQDIYINESQQTLSVFQRYVNYKTQLNDIGLEPIPMYDYVLANGTLEEIEKFKRLNEYD